MYNKRTILIKDGLIKNGPVIYWMSRDQRLHDNWALLSAENYAEQNKHPLIIIFNLVKEFNKAGSRQFRFMLRGLKEVYNSSIEFNIPFYILSGEPGSQIPKFLKDISASALFTDFDPLKLKRKWLTDVMSKTDIPVYQTDAHNIVPAFVASGKQEFSAAHFRRKITPLLADFLEEYPPLHKQKQNLFNSPHIDFDKIINDYTAAPYEISSLIPGPENAYSILDNFISRGISKYNFKNDPNSGAVSNLSPYLHFGNISSQRIALNVEKSDAPAEQKASFLDELIVRKELSDNFCFYNGDYNSFNGFPKWAKEDLNKHRKDEREFVYTLSQFENSETHDPLWNAAQNEMVINGKMHGYMRMYWCKKILEWSSSPENAISTAVYLNDKYQLDGRDPNGYAGIAWSIGGLHDRPFAERPVYGRVRYMNYNGCKRKFDIEKYINNNAAG